MHWYVEDLTYALRSPLGALVVINMLQREEQLGKSDALPTEHLQLNKDAIFFRLLYDYLKPYIVPRVVVIPDGNRATVETCRIRAPS